MRALPSGWPVALLLVLMAPVVALAEDVPPLRPYEAPWFEEPPPMPPLPPEYLTEDVDGIRFAYHPSARDRVRGMIEDAEVVRERLSSELGLEVLRSIEVRVAVGGSDFSRVVPTRSPYGTSVVAFAQLHLVVINLHAASALGASDARAVFRRGAALLALDEATQFPAHGARQGPRGLPRWFRVGYALHASEQSLLARSRALWWASMRERLIPLVDLEWHLEEGSDESVAAAQAADFVRYLLERDRAAQLGTMISLIREGQPFEQAMRAAYQHDSDAIELAWREDVARQRAFLPILAGASCLWMVVALAVYVRRRRARRASTTVALETQRAPAPAESEAAPSMDLEADHVQPHAALMVEPEVPKVAHDGRWHTLH